jgi:hypothetical protein
MSRITNTTAIRTILASAIVASGIGAQTLGAAGATSHGFAAPPTTTSSHRYEAPARQESQTASQRLLRREAILETESSEDIELRVTETTIYTENPDQHDLVIWALDRYEKAGLELPPVEIYIHSDRSECNGLNGYLGGSEETGWIVHSCGVGFTLLHELGHAWDRHNLDDETKAKFLASAQANVWRDTENWLLSGEEHAANVLAWGLMEERINQTRTRPYDHDSMLLAYQTLTGGEPLWIDA